jgi:signal transduction histidine kinase
MPEEKPLQRNLANSQQMLAASIARAVQSRLPQADSEDDIIRSVEGALLTEACHNELTIAYLRSAAVLCYTLLNALSYFQPKFAGVREFPATLTLLTFLWLCGSILFVLPLRRGWFAPWLRRAVPIADVGLIALTFFVLAQQYQAAGFPLPPGVIASAAAACLFVAFSGSLRLSRSAGRLSTGLALVTWAFVAVLGEVGGPGAAFIGVMLLSIGLLGVRITSIVRDVIVSEVRGGRLSRMYDTAQEAIDVREQVLNLVAHDLRNPLHTISMAADSLMDARADQALLISRLPTMIRRSVESMNRIIGDLLDVARSEAGTLSMDFADVSTSVLLADVAESMTPLVEKKPLRFVIADEASPRVLRADRGRIAQVFSNLVGNAVKFTPANGFVAVRAAGMGDMVRFTVTDNGKGMTEDQQQQVWGDFWQANKGDKRGIGLGLTIAKSIVEAHGGRVGVHSKLGEGTEFWFTVPAATVQSESADKRSNEKSAVH